MAEETKVEARLVEVTWMRAFKVWWSLMCRGLLFGFLGGAVIGFVLGLILGIARVDTNTIRKVCQIAGFIISVPIGIAITKVVLKKRYADFRIALIKD